MQRTFRNRLRPAMFTMARTSTPSSGLGNQKADNVRQSNKPPATISLDHADWNHIRGLSLAGTVGFVVDTKDITRRSDALLHKFSQAFE